MVGREKLNELHPGFAGRILQVLQMLAQQGYAFGVQSAYRSFEEQTKLFAQGRTAPGAIVTQAKAGQSQHNYRIAADLVPIVNGQFNWNVSDEFWQALGQAAHSCGLEWGGDWTRFKDLPHVQVPGFSVASMQSLYQQGGFEAIFAEADRVLNNYLSNAQNKQQAQPQPAQAIIPDVGTFTITAPPLSPPPPQQQAPMRMPQAADANSPDGRVVEVQRVQAQQVPSSGLFASLEKLKGLSAGVPAGFFVWIASQWTTFFAQPVLVISSVIFSSSIFGLGCVAVYCYFKNQQSRRYHDLLMKREEWAHELTMAQVESARSPNEYTVRIKETHNAKFSQ